MHQIPPHTWRTSSPLRAGLGFRYTHPFGGSSQKLRIDRSKLKISSIWLPVRYDLDHTSLDGNRLIGLLMISVLVGSSTSIAPAPTRLRMETILCDVSHSVSY